MLKGGAADALGSLLQITSIGLNKGLSAQELFNSAAMAQW